MHMEIWETPLDRRGMASLQSNSPFSFKHHLTVATQQKCMLLKIFHMQHAQQLIVNTQHTTTKLKHSEMQPRHVQCLHRIRMTYPLEIRKYNRSESSDKNHRMVEKKSWKSVNGKPFPAIATCFWKIERAVWSSGNIPFTVLTSFNFKVVIAERITMESQKKKIW